MSRFSSCQRRTASSSLHCKAHVALSTPRAQRASSSPAHAPAARSGADTCWTSEGRTDDLLTAAQAFEQLLKWPAYGTRFPEQSADGRPITTGGGSAASVAADASAKALKAGSNLSISGGSFQLDAAEDAVHSDGQVVIDAGDFTIRAADDGIHAESMLTIHDGTIDITKSVEGIESATIVLDGGEVRIVSSDDGVNVAAGGLRAAPRSQPIAWRSTAAIYTWTLRATASTSMPR